MIDVNDVLAIGGLMIAALAAWFIEPLAVLVLFGLVLCTVAILRQRGRR